MTATIIPFPIVRRRRFVVKTAARLMSMPASTAKKMLAATIKHQAAVMARRGIDPVLIEKEQRSLKAALDGEQWRQAFLPDGAA
jgi:hypothetical protein